MRKEKKLPEKIREFFFFPTAPHFGAAGFYLCFQTIQEMKLSKNAQPQPNPQPLITKKIQERISRAKAFDLSDEQKYVLYWEIRNGHGSLYQLIKGMEVFIYTSLLHYGKGYLDIDAIFHEAKQAIVLLAISDCPKTSQQEFIDRLHSDVLLSILQTCLQQKGHKSIKIFRPPNPHEQLTLLNNKLWDEEKRIAQFYARHLQPFHEQLRACQLVDDIRTGYCLRVYTFSPSCNAAHNVEEGKPIAEINFWNPEILWGTCDGLNDNWNEFTGKHGHPLFGKSFCYTMQLLAFDTKGLRWEDILDIDDVRMEVQIKYQFAVGKSSARTGNNS